MTTSQKQHNEQPCFNCGRLPSEGHTKRCKADFFDQDTAAHVKQMQEQDAKRVYVHVEMRLGSWTMTDALADETSIMMSDENALVVEWGEGRARILPDESWKTAQMRRVVTHQLVDSLTNPRYL